MNLTHQFTAVSIVQLSLMGGFLIALGVQLYYYLRYSFPLSNYQSNEKQDTAEGVSIIVAAKNEAETIEKCVQKLLDQVYTHFEIIVVNDYSEDKTLDLLYGLKSEKLTVLNNQLTPGKKSALSQAIEKAHYELLLFTDADCLPNSNFWISTMVKHFSDEKEVVLGFGAFQKDRGVLNKLIRFEGFMTALQYFGFARVGQAYMGVGRNLAYRKSSFKKIGGFNVHQAILSGDDDLLVNKVATSSNVAIEMNKEAHTTTAPECTWKRFIFQKRRQLSAGAHYKKKDKLRLAIFGAANFLYYGLFVILLLFSPFTLLILGIFVTKQVLEYLVFKRIANQLGVEDLLPLILFLEPLYIFSMTAIGVSTWFWRVNKWK